MNFEEAQKFVLKWEGGLCDDPHDAGGITKYGVCLRFLKSLEPGATAGRIRSLTVEEASAIFRKEFWEKGKCDKLPDPLDFVMYDSEVNCGVSQAVKFLQRALGIEADGVIGMVTLSAVNSSDSKETARKVLDQRSQFYNNLANRKPTQQVFLCGWLNRVRACKRYAGLED